ncbi:MAG: ribonuclease D [Verrucomicrobiales bacterium]|jgi:ribonuclease D
MPESKAERNEPEGVVAPPAIAPNEHTYIEDAKTLVEFLESFGDPAECVCAVDTEADSLHSYEEKLCLIQFGCRGRFALIDPLTMSPEEMTPLIDFIETAKVWMHGADFDMTMLRRTFNRVPELIYDTQTAARLIGLRQFGFANLVAHYYDIKLSKQSQKADWGKRPLPEKMLEYAVNDVRYLLPITEVLESHVAALRRTDWFVESCINARKTVLGRTGKDPDQVWRIQGWGRLERSALHYLRTVWLWRDDEASRRDRPPFKIMNNEMIMNIVGQLDAGENPSLPARFPRPVSDRFWKAVRKAQEAGEDEWPTIPKRERRRKDPRTDSRFSKLKLHRDRVAEDLGIDQTLIAAKATLEQLAAEPSEEKVQELFMDWQRKLMEKAFVPLLAED